MSLQRAIEARITEFLAADDQRLQWVKRAVREQRFLPLYIGWVSALGIRPDGTFVTWEHERDPGTVVPLEDGYWRRTAIFQGAKKYPELAALLPLMPPSAQVCGTCGGAGEIPGAPQLICECGGAGWLMPGEPRGPSPG